MALPTIPTSFVPHTPIANRPGAARFDVVGAFGFFSYAAMVVALIMALGVFVYGRILASSLTAKDTELAKQEAAIDQSTIQSFVRLRDRLNSGQTLLDNHIALSGFFRAIESLLPSTVRLTNVHIMIDPTGAAKVSGSGVSKSFNALSAASGAFATDGRIKDVIFSKMTVNRDNSVSFGFSAMLDQKLIAFQPGASVPELQSSAATTTATTTP